LVIPVIQEMQRGLSVMLGIQRNIETGLHQCEAKEFAFAWAVFDQEDGGMRCHNIRRTSAGNVPGSKKKGWMIKC
jgi:hypothetical protein